MLLELFDVGNLVGLSARLPSTCDVHYKIGQGSPFLGWPTACHYRFVDRASMILVCSVRFWTAAASSQSQLPLPLPTLKSEDLKYGDCR